MIDSQSVAIRKAMSLDAEWHRADAQFCAACIIDDGEIARQQRAARQRDYAAQPEHRKRRNAQKRAARAAARDA